MLKAYPTVEYVGFKEPETFPIRIYNSVFEYAVNVWISKEMIDKPPLLLMFVVSHFRFGYLASKKEDLSRAFTYDTAHVVKRI